MRDLNPHKPLGRRVWYQATLIPHYSDGTGIWIRVKQATTASTHRAILYRHFMVPPTWFEHVLKRSTASCFTRLSYGGLFVFCTPGKIRTFVSESKARSVWPLHYGSIIWVCLGCCHPKLCHWSFRDDLFPMFINTSFFLFSFSLITSYWAGRIWT